MKRLLQLFALGTLVLLSADLGYSQARRGSIYDLSLGPVRSVVSPTARQPGDLVTVLISENQDVKNEEKSDLKKDSSLDYKLTNFDLDANAFSTLPGLGGSRSDAFTGAANYQKKGTFTARLTAVVIDALPNGNLIIQGRREIRVDQEVKVIEISGIVRRFDIQSDNTVLSEQVADARVVYSGAGPLSDTTRRRGVSRWLHGVLDWIWPF
ncbi:MAG TPA: flagellar basal body L-ring protein FlgH [Planctomycetota bacterium]|mgnify:CR=1 FL=1|nr:flagellar basal body L-ring protein FlgH [Planctomycetota bacterium]HRV80024.1 flagellar basal body L-ring protein FlgH [Planctomycetota bacterium]